MNEPYDPRSMAAMRAAVNLIGLPGGRRHQPNLTAAVSGNIRAEMARRRVRQVDLATALGITQSAVSRRLLGRTPWTTRDLQVVADVLGVPATVLVEAAAA